jgi:predicted transcriptional regulator
MSHDSPDNESARAEGLLKRVCKKPRLEERMSVLQAIQDGANSRELLMERTSLAWSSLREIIGSLSDAGLLGVEDHGAWPKYLLREKGVELIKRYRGVVERIETARTVVEFGRR